MKFDSFALAPERREFFRRFKADDILNKSGVPTNYGNFNAGNRRYGL